MINLAITKHEDAAQHERIRHFVLLSTSIILGIWVLALAGFLGWSWYMNTKSNNTEMTLNDLKGQVATRSEEEILIRKLASRTQSVKDFIDSRGAPVKHLDILLSATPAASAWEYKGAQVQTITVHGEDVGTIHAFVNTITPLYTSVAVDSVSLTKEEGWKGIITVGGLKP